MPDREPELSPLCDADPLARALAKLRPAAPTGVDPLRVTFLAGQASRAADAAFWKRAFAAQCVLSGSLAAGLVWLLVASFDPVEAPVAQSTPAPVPKVAPPAPEPAPAPRAVPDPYPEPFELTQTPPTNTEELAEYLRVRREVLTAGLGLLPESKTPPRPPANPAELERLLQLPPGVLASPFVPSPKPKAPSEPE